jgi:hypothetical protein
MKYKIKLLGDTSISDIYDAFLWCEANFIEHKEWKYAGNGLFEFIDLYVCCLFLIKWG